MIFKTITLCPPNVDTIIHYMKEGELPTFSCESLQNAFDFAFGGDDFALKSGDIKVYRMKFDGKFVNVILAGFDGTDFRKVTLQIGQQLNDLKAQVVFVDNFFELDSLNHLEAAHQFASTLPLCDYAFDKYLSKKKDYTQKEIYIFASEELESALQEGANIAKGIFICRDLVNEPAEVMTPSKLADCAAELGKTYGFEVEIFDKEACKAMGMHAFLAVARGSANEPKLIVMRYNGGTGIAKGVIGKGLCYDSGGLFLKPGDSMSSMKSDMAGSAAVIGALCSIAMNKVPQNIVAVVAACENLVDGAGYKNGDIIQTMNGKTVFIGSTDAEGRMTLADAITYMIQKEEVDSIIELSTLTGSCANFLQNICCGVVTTDDALYQKLSDVSALSGEKFWRLPVYEEYRELIKNDIADLTNTSTGGAGGITAGLFLDEFSGDMPFMHLDIAGHAFAKTAKPGYPKGATGFGVRSVYEYLKN